jgi:hypothetical protein
LDTGQVRNGGAATSSLASQAVGQLALTFLSAIGRRNANPLRDTL